MKTLKILFLLLFMTHLGLSQEIIKLPNGQETSAVWEGNEKEYFSNIWQTQVVTNVSIPTMEVFRPENPNGTAVIVAPGGGLYALSILSEGDDVAKWLNKKGITAFVLKYRLVPTGEDGVKEITDAGTTNPNSIFKNVQQVLPLSWQDGLNAISHVRQNAMKYNIDTTKIGFMGFSAGGAVTMGVAFNYTKENRPDFLVPVYPWMTVMGEYTVPNDAPPMLVICASDDPLGLAPGSAKLYSDWLSAGKIVGLHMYSKGGHGFGMRTQNLPSDSWIERFYDWSLAEGITNTK
ncbi:acetyl esterase/lipase [Saonia flava]|uniref:Acetyl esterase/lipase n=1 Tax=Saonia flava TaxID=523696 RepID=A0A846R358_9FLAO|nr:alpha/beta hydrolase [Saonia flava]NJB72405.1 acetyl esterase/lipase [Saonia flava]